MRPYSIEPLIQEESGPKRSWKKWVLGVGLCLLLLLVVAWNIAGSEWFLRTVVLPRAGESINGSITFQSADWSLSRSLVLRGITLKAEGQRSCFKAAELQVNYDLKQLLGGETHLHQVRLVKPEVTVHMDEEGNTNLDPFFDHPKKQPSSAPLVKLDKIEVFEGTLQFVRQFAGGGEEHFMGANLQVQAERIGNELAGGEFNLSTGLQYVLLQDEVPPESIKGTLSLKTSLAFDRKWIPTAVESVARVKINEANGQFEIVRNLVVDCESVVTQGEIKQFDFNFSQGSSPIGTLSVQGPWNLKEGSAQLDVDMDGLDRRVLNLAGSRLNLNFHSTVISSTNHLVLSQFGKQAEISGVIRSKPFQLSYGRVLMPALEVLQSDYQARIDFVGHRVDVKKFQLNAHHNDRKLVEANIVKPMVLAWGKEEIQAPDSTLKIAFTDIKAAEWQPWIGRFVREGQANIYIDVVSKKAGQQIDFTLSGSGNRLKVPLQENEIDVGNFDLDSSGKLKDFNLLSFDRLTTRLGSATDPVLHVSWPFELDINKKWVSGHLVAGGQGPILLGWNPKIKTHCQSGIFDYNGTLALGFGESASQNLDGQLVLRGFTGGNSRYSATNLTAKVVFKASLEKGRDLSFDSLNAVAKLNEAILAKQIYTAGKLDLQTGVADLSNLTLKDVDLKLVNQIVPLGALHEGNVSTSLKIIHEPGEKTQLIGTASILSGHVKGWPESIHAALTQFNADLLWSEKGRFKAMVREFQLKALNHDDQNRQDAFFTGSVEEYDPDEGRLDCTLKQSEVTHVFLQSLLAKQLGESKLTAGKITHSKPLKIRLDGRGGIQIKGELKGEDILFRDPSKQLPAEILGAETDFNINYVHKGANWDLNASKIVAAFTLGGRKGGGISLKGEYRSFEDEGDFNGSLIDVDYRIINLLPESWRPGIRLNAGKIERFDVAGKLSKGKASGRLFANLKGVEITDKSGLWPANPTNVEHEFRGTVGWSDDSSIYADLNKGLIKQGDKTIAEYDFNGSKQGGDYNFEISKLEIGPEFNAKALAKWIPEQKMRAGKIQVHQSELILPRIGAGKFKGNIEFNGFVLEPGSTRKTPTALDTTLTVDATAKDRIFQINDFTALLPGTEKTVNKAKVSGKLNLSQMRNPRADLKLYSNELDITPLMDLLLNNKPVPAAQADVVQKTEAQEPTPNLKNNSSATNRFALKQFKIGLDLKRLRWRDLVATDINGSVEINDRKYTFSPVEMRLMGEPEPAMIEGYVVAAPGNDIQYDLNMSCQNLPLNPIVRHFHPENKVEWGKLTAKCYVKGEALTGEAFKRTFFARGKDPSTPAFLEIKDAHWGFKEDDPIIGLIAGPLVLDLPELLNSHFNGAKLEIKAGQGKADFRLGAQGPLLIAATEGQGELGKRFIDSNVNQNVEIALQQILAKKFMKLDPKKLIFGDQNQFWKLPTLLKLSGPVRRPKASVNDAMILFLGTQKLLGRPMSLLQIIPNPFRNDPAKKKGEEGIDPFHLLVDPEVQDKNKSLNPLDLLRSIIPGTD